MTTRLTDETLRSYLRWADAPERTPDDILSLDPKTLASIVSLARVGLAHEKRMRVRVSSTVLYRKADG